MIKSYIINLDRNPERMEAISKQFKELGLPYQRHIAIDGKNISDDALTKFAEARPRVKLVGKWTKGKMGCHLSHRGLWEIAANSSDPYTAIFEDDLIVSDHIRDALISYESIPEGCDIVRLESTAFMSCLISQNETVPFGNRTLHKILPNQHKNYFPMGAGAYILSRDAARKLIEAPLEVFVYTDRSLFDCATSGIAPKLNNFQISPAYCVQDKYFHSDPEDILFNSEIEVSNIGNIYKNNNKLKAALREYGSKIGVFQIFSRLRYLYFYTKGYREIPFQL